LEQVRLFLYSRDAGLQERMLELLPGRRLDLVSDLGFIRDDYAADRSILIFDLDSRLDGLAQLRAVPPDLPLVVLADSGQARRLETEAPALRIVTKPALLELRRTIADLAPNGSVAGFHLPDLLGHSARLEEVKAIIQRVAGTDVTILVRGESGTGKELVARAIHEASLRRSKPYVTVLCPAIPEGLLESELFGYEKGSFTGAFRRQPGKFEIANHGTIFLDEIGDIPFGLQAKLLHVLQGGGIARVGGADQRVDVRIVAATNKDLELSVSQGTFREDLYYRLNVVSIHLPPLRERKDDIPVLVDAFLRKYHAQFNKDYQPLSETSLDPLLRYEWPGNIRELENLVKRVVIMGSEEMVLRSYFHEARRVPRTAQVPAPAAVAPAAEPQPAANAKATVLPRLKQIAKEATRKAEAEVILKTLEQTRWNRKAAARLLGISYKALLYKIRQCNLDNR
jgi:two-component system response regulator AtoC